MADESHFHEGLKYHGGNLLSSRKKWFCCVYFLKLKNQDEPMNRNVYAKEPLAFRGSIPIFSRTNEYTDNYAQISSDHIESIQKDGTNPFIEEEMWFQFEHSTMTLIEKYADSNDKILDVGVGLGRLLDNFPHLERYGLDISFGYLEIAQSKGIDVCYALINDMPYQEGIFDIVVSTDVLEHVLNLNQSVTKMLSVLKKGGMLIVRVPYRENLAPYLDPTYPYKYVHLRNFDEYSLRLLFERIFECQVLEVAMAGYIEDKTRWKWPWPPRGYSRLMDWLNKLRVISPPLYKAVLRNLFNSIEINVVVRKP